MNMQRTLKQYRSINERAQSVPLLAITKRTKFDDLGFEMFYFAIDGEPIPHYSIDGSAKDGYIVSHAVYGGDYGRGATPAEALREFANKSDYVKNIRKLRKIAAKVVAKHGA